MEASTLWWRWLAASTSRLGLLYSRAHLGGRGRPMTVTSYAMDLQRLMAIADGYARRLVADAGPSCAVLLIERAGDLDVVTLDDLGRGFVARARGLIAYHRATSAALLVEVRTASIGRAADTVIRLLGEPVDTVFCIVGETIEGVRDERYFRVRRCGRGRRLTPLTGGRCPEVEYLSRPLFLVHVPHRRATAAPGDLAAVATGGGPRHGVARRGDGPRPHRAVLSWPRVDSVARGDQRDDPAGVGGPGPSCRESLRSCPR